ncbi:MAG TPA: sigma-70 family RNA polymerase sigma factor [Bacteroidales bacterium]|nr:sigma-70 family RNA polymerase sigma factor [Bacteroidales bacterium]
MNNDHPDTNNRLIEDCLEGDIKAQFRLYKKYSMAMYNISVRITGNRMDAEDIIQESFMTVFSRLGELDNKAAFGSWLKRIVINNSVSLIRTKRVIFEDLDDSIESDETVIVETEDQIDPAIVHNAIKDLPDGGRAVLVLYALEGYKHREISQLLGISESTSKTQYKRALQLLNNNLKKKIYAD